jgi:arylformamidase
MTAPGPNEWARATAELAAMLDRYEAIDLSPSMYTNMPQWPTHPDVLFVPDARNFTQDGYYLQLLVLPEHSGAHVDVPAHGHRELGHMTVDSFPVTALWGQARKIDVSDRDWKPGELLTLAEFRERAEAGHVSILPGDIVIVEFGWDRYLEGAETDHAKGRWWGANMPGFAEDLCAYLGQAKPRAIGTDTAGCDIAVVNGVVQTEMWGHTRDFLPQGILLLEGLTNLHSCPSDFYLVALPLRIRGGSGSPLRPVGLVPRR